jgi:signal transduction histidine kinase
MCYSNLTAQSEKNTYLKILELRDSPLFNAESTEHIDLLLNLAKKKVRTNPDSSIVLLDQGYNLSKKANYKNGESIALSTYAFVYFENGEIEKSSEYNIKALSIAEEFNLGKAKLAALNNIGIDNLLQGKLAKALTNFMEALVVAKALNDFSMMANLNVNIANIYSENADYETALSFLDKARQLNVQHNDVDVLPYTLLSMASEYSNIKKYDEAKQLLVNSIAYFEKENIIDWLSHAYELKGAIELEQNNYNEALKWLIKSEKLCDEIDFKYGYTIVYNELAETYFALNKVDLAEDYGLKALKVSTEQNITSNLKKSYLILSKIYYQKEQYKLGYQYQTKYLKLYEKDSEEKFKKGLGILRSKIKFENQKKQIILDKNKAIAKQKNYVYITVFALFVVLLVMLSIFRTNKLQRKFTKELQEKQNNLLKREAELSTANDTKNKLFSIIAHDLKSPINSFHSLMEFSNSKDISKDEYDILFPKALKDIQGISEMLNNLLIWSRTQMKGIVLKQINIDVFEVVNTAISLLVPVAHKKQITIINEIPKNTISFSDKNHLNIVLRNLISNAIKFTNKSGKIVIGSKHIDGCIQVFVKDNGTGMNSETKNMVFKKASMKATYGTNKERGTGLGLSICKDMIERNKGKIWITSEEHIGTTVYFTIPEKM